MIQDIQPVQFNNQYKHIKPNEDDLIICFHSNKFYIHYKN